MIDQTDQQKMATETYIFNNFLWLLTTAIHFYMDNKKFITPVVRAGIDDINLLTLASYKRLEALGHIFSSNLVDIPVELKINATTKVILPIELLKLKTKIFMFVLHKCNRDLRIADKCGEALPANMIAGRQFIRNIFIETQDDYERLKTPLRLPIKEKDNSCFVNSNFYHRD